MMWLRVGLQALLVVWFATFVCVAVISVSGWPLAVQATPAVMILTAFAAVCGSVAYLVSFMTVVIVTLLLASTCVARALSSGLHDN